jgi:hypothetical protein
MKKDNIWLSPEGKEIPFTTETILTINGEEEGLYQIQITQWPKSTSLEIIHSYDLNDDPLDPCIQKKIYQVGKFSHSEFKEKKEQLISNAETWIKRRLPHLY